MMKGKTILTTNFNVNGIEIIGSIKYNDDDTFVEISYHDKNNQERITQKIYTGDIYNQEQMIFEIESLIEESLDTKE